MPQGRILLKRMQTSLQSCGDQLDMLRCSKSASEVQILVNNQIGACMTGCAFQPV